jgi:hypothetical protein
MIEKTENVGAIEKRFIGDCPWCGEEVILLRDYMCSKNSGICCYDFYRLLPNKVSIALRSFPNRTVDISTQFDELIDSFYECCHTGQRSLDHTSAACDIAKNTVLRYTPRVID